MDALAFQPAATARPRPAPPRRATLPDEAEEREILFGLLSPCLGCMEAAEAVEAVLARFGGLAEALAAAPRDLAALPELGEAGAAALRAVLAAAQRLDRLRQSRRVVLTDAAAWAAHLRRPGAGVPMGEFRALFLDPHGVLLAEEMVGTTDAAAVPGQVIRRALALDAADIVLARGCRGAQGAVAGRDAAMARSLEQAAQVMGLRLRDMLVMGRAGHASVRDARGVAPAAPG